MRTANRPVLAHDARESLKRARSIVVLYALISLGTVGVIYALRNHRDLVTSAVWTRGVIVAATSLLMLSFASGALHGRARALLRLRIVSAVMVAVIAVIVALPGAFPIWLRAEQAVCGVLLLGVVAIVNRRKVRAGFAD